LKNACNSIIFGLELIRKLSTGNPDDTQWRRDVSSSLERVGNVLKIQGDLVNALAAYREAVDIIRALTTKDADNRGWQRDLSVDLEKVGLVLQAQGDLAGARAAFRQGLDIARALAAKDPDNTTWQTDLVTMLMRMASAGDDPRARWTEAHEILMRLKSQGRLTPAGVEQMAKIEDELAKLTHATAQ
jgi:tetratricopeptide (TPR) repeat protein